MKIRIKQNAFQKMINYADSLDKEISGFGTVKRDQDGFLIDDIFIVPQIVTEATTEMTPDDLMKIMQDAMLLGKDTSDWLVWWHSHVRMRTYFSTVDVATIEALAGSEPLISICVNQLGDYAARFDQYGERLTHPVELVTVDDCIVTGLKAQCVKEVKEMVTEMRWKDRFKVRV
jgi:proteasome lid subunit RPN8/RPN11